MTIALDLDELTLERLEAEAAAGGETDAAAVVQRLVREHVGRPVESKSRGQLFVERFQRLASLEDLAAARQLIEDGRSEV